MSKGSNRRPESIPSELSELRWRLAFGKDTPEVKAEIKRKIAQLENNKK